MKLIENEKFNILEADNGYVLKDKNDIYIPAYIDNEGNEIEEYIPYYFKKAYIPKNITLEEVEKLYDEVLEGE